MCVHVVRTQSHIFPSFFFFPHSDIITNFPYRSTNFKVQISPITAFVDIAYVLSMQELCRPAASALSLCQMLLCLSVDLSLCLSACVYVSVRLSGLLSVCVYVWMSAFVCLFPPL